VRTRDMVVSVRKERFSVRVGGRGGGGAPVASVKRENKHKEEEEIRRGKYSPNRKIPVRNGLTMGRHRIPKEGER